MRRSSAPGAEPAGGCGVRRPPAYGAFGRRLRIVLVTHSHGSAGQLATAGRDGTVKLWDPISGEVLQTLSGHQQPVQAVAFTPNAVRLATASVDHSVKIWELFTGKEIAILQGHKDAVNDVVYNPKKSEHARDGGVSTDVCSCGWLATARSAMNWVRMDGTRWVWRLVPMGLDWPVLAPPATRKSGM